MTNTIIIGMQWGDEGKGKDVDILSENHHVIVRYQGGANAGHTVKFQDKKYVLHLIPSGILRKDKLNILGNNVVINPFGFLEEINNLQQEGIEVIPKNLKISDRAPITLLYHIRLDEVIGKRVGTTGRGIGPTYIDKIGRVGIRTCDLFDLKNLEEKVRENLGIINHILKYYNAPQLSLEEIMKGLPEAAEKIIPFIDHDIGGLILKYDGSLLFEGAQGTLLDVDLGTYPFVTSSNPTIGGAFTGTGVYPYFDNIIGILKAYTTRVGNGPFPTEQNNEIGKRLREIGGEFGATTGRPRRCGWLDLFAALSSTRNNGITEISLTKLDVLSKEDEIYVCIGYLMNGERIDYFPPYLDDCVPVYKKFPGWKENISNVRKPEDLPGNALKYIKFIEEYLNTDILRIGVGPKRDQTIEL